MNKFPLVTGAALLLTFAASSYAQSTPFSMTASAGPTQVSYGGDKATGYAWNVRGSYLLTPFSSVNLGYGETNADLKDDLGDKHSYKAYTVPLTMTLRQPFAAGDVYLRAGGQYYNRTYKDNESDGFGLTGAIGINLLSTNASNFSLEVGYSTQGSADSTSITVGAGLGF
ncbi:MULTISPECIES: outer membrane beta-barrel protein [Vibrio]|uniref:outer membrane beta-barrel protein n=1 Tax=Vibrio TaxID=662 RepID=UPI000C170777|nr:MULTISPECIES: outer membrane beta-barrel protein [Vibrio]NAW69453.1 hypothetical protein [Vibrio sp. V28_P6S34P95]NAX06403.1 hypothetical protein [Vibrio sp. V30_P3S12P165]NAX33372.1 hypothetical protein [Vibrio sp. V29_P1S30P107]NAX36200.1 hypothetical protein [Vibrio sp. V27_P1S3P104]NNN44946.1 porin family protein [Vibrio sp. 1-1(7)]